MNNAFLSAAAALMLLAFNSAGAAVYDAPKSGDDVIGALDQTTAVERDTLVELGRNYNLGYREMKLANPDIDPWLPGEGSQILLPSLFVLPDTAREGIVLNLAEMRLYYFPPEGSDYAGKVITYPLGVGREGWGTPLGKTSIIYTRANPTWTPPESIKKEHAENNDPLPDVVPAGPDNPLGQFALYLGFPTYLLHGTNKPGGIGLRVSHGCIRLYPEDIAALFSMVGAGTPVNIVDQPIKTGWLGDKLLLEVHPADGTGNEPVTSHTPFVQRIIDITKSSPDTEVNWERAEAVGTVANGMPEVIALRKTEPPKAQPEDESQHDSKDAEQPAPEDAAKAEPQDESKANSKAESKDESQAAPKKAAKAADEQTRKTPPESAVKQAPETSEDTPQASPEAAAEQEQTPKAGPDDEIDDEEVGEKTKPKQAKKEPRSTSGFVR